MNATAVPSPAAPLSRWRQYHALTKPRVVQLIAFCAAIGMLLAVPGLPGLDELRVALYATLGIWLVASAAAAFNCLIEQHIDARMKRTSWRPTARGDLGRGQALGFSAVLCSLGMAMLGPLSRKLGGSASCGLSTSRRALVSLLALSVTVSDSPISTRSVSTLKVSEGWAEGAWA